MFEDGAHVWGGYTNYVSRGQGVSQQNFHKEAERQRGWGWLAFGAAVAGTTSWMPGLCLA